MSDTRNARWIEWMSTTLQPSEVAGELDRLGKPQREALDDRGWFWQPGRVIWRDPSGALRRARFTHWTTFRTQKGEFEIDSAGQARERFEGGACGG